jgi:WD40 repeat protein
MQVGRTLRDRIVALWRRVIWFVAGPDIFLSYSRLDGARYAAALGSALNTASLDFHCFLDQWDAPPGRRIPLRVLRALRRATMLVVVGSPAAAVSTSVLQEVVEFRRRSWRIIPISFGGALESAPWFEHVEGLAIERESVETLNEGAPSPHVVHRIQSSYVYSKRNGRVRRTLGAAAAALMVLLAVSIYASREATARQQETRARQILLEANQLRSEQGAALPATVLLAAEATQRLSGLGVEAGAAVRSLGEGLSLLRPLERSVKLPHAARDIRFLPDGRHALAITTDNAIYLIDFDQPPGNCVMQVAPPQDIATPTEDGTAVLVAGKRTGVWRLPSRQFVEWVNAPTASVAALSDDGMLVSLSSNSAGLWIWRPGAPSRPVDHFDLGEYRIRDMVFRDRESAPVLTAVSATPYTGRFVSTIQHRLWMLEPDTKRLRFFDMSDTISRIAVSADGTRIMTAGRKPRSGGRGANRNPHRVTIWNAVKDPENHLPGEYAAMDGVHLFLVRSVAFDTLDDISFDTEGTGFAIIGDGRLELGDARGDSVRFGPGEIQTAGAIVKGDQVMTLNADGTARLYDRSSEVARFTHAARLSAGALDSAHSRAMTASGDGELWVWRLRHPMIVDERLVENATDWLISPDGGTGVSAAQGAVELWTTATLSPAGRISAGFVIDVRAFRRDGQRLAVAGITGYGAILSSGVEMYDTHTRAAIGEPIRVDGRITDLRVDGETVLGRVEPSSVSSARLLVWSPRSGRVSWPYGQPTDADAPDLSLDVMLAEDGSGAIVQLSNNRLELWATGTGRMTSASVGPNERLLGFGGLHGFLLIGPALTADENSGFRTQGAGTVRVVGGSRLQPVATFAVRKSEEVSALSPDSRYILTQPTRSELRVIDGHSGQDRLNIATLGEFARSSFSTDSTYLVVADYEGVIRLYDVATWHQIAHVPTHSGAHDILMLGSPPRLITSNNGGLTYWRWDPPALIDAACRIVGRSFSAAECNLHFSGESCPSLCPSSVGK